jgi:hypothetical protein
MRNTIVSSIKKNVFDLLKIYLKNENLTYEYIDEIDRYYFDFWYDEKNFEKNFNFYEDREYLCVAFKSWYGWTANSTRITINFLNDINYIPKKLVDFGAGIGLSIIQFKQQFKDCEFVYCNVKDSFQWKFTEEIFKKFNIENIKMVDINDVYSELKNADVVTAYECFEHIKNPIDIMKNLLIEKPFLYVDNTSFSIKAPGHFDNYENENKIYNKGQISRIFYKEIKKSYTNQQDFICFPVWNARPKFFINNERISINGELI